MSTTIDQLDVRSLRILHLLLTEKSVSRVALKMDMSQPAMSHVLRRLRLLFKDPLLIPGPSGMVRSDRGHELADSTRDILARIDRLLEPQLSFDPAGSRRRFVVTAAAYSEFVLMPQVARRMRLEAPLTQLEVRAAPYLHTFEGLERGELEMHIAWGQGPAPSTLRSVSLFADRVVCLTHRPAKGKAQPLTTAQFLAAPHARAQSSERTTSSQVIDNAVAKSGRALNIALRVQSFASIPQALIGTDLVATLPLRLAEALAKDAPLAICPVPLRIPQVRVMGYWHERSHNDPGHQWFRQRVIEAGRSLQPESAS